MLIIIVKITNNSNLSDIMNIMDVKLVMKNAKEHV